MLVVVNDKTRVRVLNEAGDVVTAVGFGSAGRPADLEIVASAGQTLLVVTSTTADRAIIDTRSLADGTRVSVRRLTISDLVDTTLAGSSLTSLVRTSNGMRLFVVDTTDGTLTHRIAVTQPTTPIAVASLSVEAMAVIGNTDDGPKAAISDLSGNSTLVRLR